jgi:hypothetical protein
MKFNAQIKLEIAKIFLAMSATWITGTITLHFDGGCYNGANTEQELAPLRYPESVYPTQLSPVWVETLNILEGHVSDLYTRRGRNEANFNITITVTKGIPQWPNRLNRRWPKPSASGAMI